MCVCGQENGQYWRLVIMMMNITSAMQSHMTASMTDALEYKLLLTADDKLVT